MAKIKNAYHSKVALVTGGGAGIGRELCLELARRGCRVVVTGRSFSNVEQTALEIKNQGGEAMAMALDVQSREEVERTLSQARTDWGRLDFLFNNAGISIAGEVRDLSVEHWNSVISVNLMGVIHCTMAAYKIMVDQGYGHIVNISSLAGLLPFPIKAPYATTKHAIVGLSTTLRAEAASLGVKVTVACPGLVGTDIWEKTPIQRATNRDVMDIVRFPMMSPGKCAATILNQTPKNRGIIIFPAHARLLWWLYRVHPSLLTPMGWKMMRDFRKIRKS